MSSWINTKLDYAEPPTTAESRAKSHSIWDITHCDAHTIEGVSAPGYSDLFGLTGRRYIVVAFIARLPLAMAQLGTLMLVAMTSGSYTRGGMCAGAVAIANAIGAPLFASWTDRNGQRTIVAAQCLAGAAFLTVEVLTCALNMPWLTTLIAGALAGFAMPQIGQLARVRWRPIIAHRGGSHSLMAIAFSYEGAADEASFVIGPLLVGLGVALFNTYAPLLLAAAMLVAFGLVFARHPSAAYRSNHSKGASQTKLLSGALVILIFAQFLIGNVFGSVQTGTTKLAQLAGHGDSAGLFHSLLGVGSVLAGIMLGRARGIPDFPRRLVLFSVTLCVLSLPLARVHHLTSLAAVLLILGCAIAPYMITTFTLAELITDPSRTATAMTLLAGATGIGYATGAAVAGYLADHHGPHGAFMFTLVPTILAPIIALGAKASLSNRAQAALKDDAR